MLYRSTLLPLLVGATTLVWSLNLKTQAQETPRPPDAFTDVTAAIVVDKLDDAAQLLKAMKARGLQAEQISRWNTLAARVALRQGDIKWLREINDVAELGATADDLLILSAMRSLLAARLDETRETLKRIKDPEKLSEIPRRRYMELWARLEQLSGDQVAEKLWLEKLVDFGSKWGQGVCQSCHTNPKVSGESVTSFDINNWWVGKRYVALLNDTKSTRQVTEAAVKSLAADANDTESRLRWAYALRASGDEDGAIREMRQFPWAVFPDRDFKKPLRFATFP